jgi:hypothetical protein
MKKVEIILLTILLIGCNQRSEMRYANDEASAKMMVIPVTEQSAPPDAST